MTLTLAVDSNNDIFVGDDGNLAVASGLSAVLMACAHAAKTVLGEMLFAIDQGLPYFEEVWNGTPNLLQFEAYLRRAILAAADVVAIQELIVIQANSELSYTITIETIYGMGTLNG